MFGEMEPAAKDAIAQILTNSRMCAEGQRPICQDTGIVVVFLKVGMDVRWDATMSVTDMVNEGVRRAYLQPDNVLRASIVSDPAFSRKNTRDNTPAVVHYEIVPGHTVEVKLAAKGGGSENKSKFVMLNPSDSIVDWVLKTVPTMGAGWCPPGMLGIGIGGTAEKAMLLAKESLMGHIDMTQLKARGPQNRIEELRIELFDKVNALGIGAQGLGGLFTQHPADGVGDVGLAATVGADDARDAFTEVQIGAVTERLEALDLELVEEHPCTPRVRGRREEPQRADDRRERVVVRSLLGAVGVVLRLRGEDHGVAVEERKGQRALAAGQQGQSLLLLARRPGDDVDAGLRGVDFGIESGAGAIDAVHQVLNGLDAAHADIVRLAFTDDLQARCIERRSAAAESVRYNVPLFWYVPNESRIINQRTCRIDRKQFC